jgi:hypothetical protein
LLNGNRPGDIIEDAGGFCCFYKRAEVSLRGSHWGVSKRLVEAFYIGSFVTVRCGMLRNDGTVECIRQESAARQAPLDIERLRSTFIHQEMTVREMRTRAQDVVITERTYFSRVSQWRVKGDVGPPI